MALKSLHRFTHFAEIIGGNAGFVQTGMVIVVAAGDTLGLVGGYRRRHEARWRGWLEAQGVVAALALAVSRRRCGSSAVRPLFRPWRRGCPAARAHADINTIQSS